MSIQLQFLVMLILVMAVLLSFQHGDIAVPDAFRTFWQSAFGAKIVKFQQGEYICTHPKNATTQVQNFKNTHIDYRR
jgi:hypothetical protein